jgi:hypothetical protein
MVGPVQLIVSLAVIAGGFLAGRSKANQSTSSDNAQLDNALAGLDGVEIDRIGRTSRIVGGYADVAAYAGFFADVVQMGPRAKLWWQRWALIQSFSESKGNHNAANRSARESRASRSMYEKRNNNAKLAQSVGSFPAEHWWFPGSSGWFGLMPTVLVNVTAGKNARGIGLGPRWTFDRWASTVGYYQYLLELLQRPEWQRSSKDGDALKAGGAAGGLMDDPHKPRYQTSQRNLAKAVRYFGFPSNFGSEPIPAGVFNQNFNTLAIYKVGRNG